MNKILIVTNKFDTTVDMVIEQLEKRDCKFYRLNSEDFPSQVKCTINQSNESVDGYFNVGYERKVNFSEINSIYYRRPGRHRIDEGIQVKEHRKFAYEESTVALSGALMLPSVVWLNDPQKIKIAEIKIKQLQIAKNIGFRIPKTLITNEPAQIIKFFDDCDGQIITKPLTHGVLNVSGEYNTIYTNRVTKEHLKSVGFVEFAPCLFQEYVNKAIELRVTIVGKSIFAAEIHSQNSEIAKDDWRRYDIENTPHKIHKLPQEIENLCLDMVSYYHLNFAAFDFVLTPEGKYVFLEMNPNGQWGWIESLTGLPICNAIADFLCGTNVL